MSSLDCFTLSQKIRLLSDAAHYQVECYLRYIQSRNYADGTLLAVCSCLRRFLLHQSTLRRRQLSSSLYLTTAAGVAHFVSSASRSGLAPSTINNTLSVLAPMFDFFVDEEKMRQQPIRRSHYVFAPLHLPKPMAENDVKQFFRVIDKVSDRLLFLLMLRCGLRVSEAAHLQWTDIDSSSGTVRINNSKGQVDRILYLSPDVEQTLNLWREADSNKRWLFPSLVIKNKPLAVKTIARRMNRYLEKAGVERHYTPHNLRHTFATQQLTSGAS